MTRAVLWDLDGTLVDSAEYHWLAWRNTMARAGHPITYEQFLASFGLRNDRILAAWMPAGTPERVIEQLGDEKEAEFRRLARERGLTPLPGAAEWVTHLHGDGWKQAIAEFKADPSVEYIEPNWEIKLDAIPNDAMFPQLWGMRNTGQFPGGTPGADIHATNAWDVFTGNPNTLIGVIDTGWPFNRMRVTFMPSVISGSDVARGTFAE